MKRLLLTAAGCLAAIMLFAQQTDTLALSIEGVSIHSVLTQPKGNRHCPLAIFIAGSGPTDLDGNQAQMKNNSLRYLSDALVAANIATLRFDKRGIAHSAYPSFSEANLTIDRYVQDVVAIIGQMKARGFSDIYIVGHSEGSLIGLIALQSANVKGFISLAGAGFPADEILKTQLKPKLPAEMFASTVIVIDSLKKGFQVKNAPPQLYSLFRPSVQPYLISWFRYSPTDLISKLNCPALIVQGDKDLQITVSDAENLAKAAKNGKLVLVKGMNHVLKSISGTIEENIASYTNPTLPIDSILAKSIADFILPSK